METNLHIAFHQKYYRFLDENLNCISQVSWVDQFPDINSDLMRHSIAPNHESSEIKGFIGTFKFDRSEIDNIQRKSVYDLKLSGDKTFEGASFLVTRLELDNSIKCLRLHK